MNKNLKNLKMNKNLKNLKMNKNYIPYIFLYNKQYKYKVFLFYNTTPLQIDYSCFDFKPRL